MTDAARFLPFDDTYWVEPGRLLAGRHPGADDPGELRENLERLLELGIHSFVDLTVEGELEPYDAELRRIAGEQRLDVTYMRHPIGDMSIPQRGEMRAIQQTIDRALSAAQPMYVHCWAGLGRTGMVIGVYLIRRGRATPRSFVRVLAELRARQAARGASPQTPEQVRFVRRFAHEGR
ncbi:MAG: dual specificity protein phosphatase family protein [Myxococcota bacterium]